MPKIYDHAYQTLSQGSNLVLGIQNRVRLPLGTTYQALRLRLTGTLTVATAAATILEDSPLGLLRQIDLLLAGGQPLRSLDARAIYRLNQMQNEASQPRLVAPSGAIGSSTFTAELYIDLWQPDLLYGLPRAFWLDARFLNGLELVVTVGTDADVATIGGGGTDTLSNVALGIDLIEIVDYGGQLSRMQQIRQIVQAVGATGVLPINPFTGGGIYYRGFLIRATSGNADPNRATSDDTIIQDVSVLLPSRRAADVIPWERLRAQFKQTYGLQTLMPGTAIIDFAREHQLADILDTIGEQTVTMQFTIAAAPANAVIQIYPLVFQKRRIAGRPNVIPAPVPVPTGA